MTALPGFVNEGNTCYVDVVLFLMLVPFARFTRTKIFDAPLPRSTVPGCDPAVVVQTLRDAYRNIYDANAVRCGDFRAAINRCITGATDRLENVSNDAPSALIALFRLFGIQMMQEEVSTNLRTGATTTTQRPTNTVTVLASQVPNLGQLEQGVQEVTEVGQRMLSGTVMTYQPQLSPHLLVVEANRASATGMAKDTTQLTVPGSLFGKDLFAIVVHISSHYVALFKYPNPDRACQYSWYMYNDSYKPSVVLVGDDVGSVMNNSSLDPRRNGVLFFYYTAGEQPWDDLYDTEAAVQGSGSTPVQTPNTGGAAFEPQAQTREFMGVTPAGAPSRKRRMTVAQADTVPAQAPSPKPNQTPDVGVLRTNAQQLLGLYSSPTFAFPRDSIRYLYDQPNMIRELGPRVRVYAPSGTQGEVTKLVERREPANIGMVEYYDRAALMQAFGWDKSYYRTHFETQGTLAPNFGVYCHTPVHVSATPITPGNYDQVTFTAQSPMVHVYNAIGLAFDSQQQPDYQYVFKMPSEEARKRFVLAVYTNLFHRAFRCALDLRLSTIVLSAVGANNFATYYPQLRDPAYVFMPALERARREAAYSGKITFMGISEAREWQRVREEYGSIGFFPANISNVDTATTLFVNAWDPHSIVGNGNAEDRSLDGFMGRTTAMGLLCWPPSNNYMRIEVVPEI